MIAAPPAILAAAEHGDPGSQYIPGLSYRKGGPGFQKTHNRPFPGSDRLPNRGTVERSIAFP